MPRVLWRRPSEVLMRLENRNALPAAANETAYNRDRRARHLVLQAEDAERTDQRRISYALIDSTLSKWRYPAVGMKGSS